MEALLPNGFNWGVDQVSRPWIKSQQPKVALGGFAESPAPPKAAGGVGTKSGRKVAQKWCKWGKSGPTGVPEWSKVAQKHAICK